MSPQPEPWFCRVWPTEFVNQADSGGGFLQSKSDPFVRLEIERLLKTANLTAQRDADAAADPDLQANWAIVRDWGEESRYERKTQAEATHRGDHGRRTRGAPMDQATLVGPEIDDVTRLVDQLRRDQFDVKAAFWLYTSEAGQWYLYLASDAVEQKGLAEAYMAVGRTMRQMPDLRIDFFQVKLVAPDSPLARGIIEYQSSPHVRLPRRITGTRLGDVTVEDSYIYRV